MFFYTALIIVCLITAAAIPLFYYLIKGAGTAIARTTPAPTFIRPIRRMRANPGCSTFQDIPVTLNPRSNEARGAFAWSGTEKSKVELRFSEDHTYHGPGKEYSMLSQAKVQTQGAWIREDKPNSIGKVYKVSRRVRAENGPKTFIHR